MTRNDLYAPSNEILNNFTFLERNSLNWLIFDISFHSLASFALFENSGKNKAFDIRNVSKWCIEHLFKICKNVSVNSKTNFFESNGLNEALAAHTYFFYKKLLIRNSTFR